MTRARVVSGLVPLVVGGLVLAGCSDKQGGTASPVAPPAASSSQSDAGSALPAAGAPKVENPLTGTQPFQDEPCSVLTPEQVGRLGVPPQGKKDRGATGPECRWYDPETSGSVNIQWIETTKSGLTGLYQSNAQGGYEFFQPMAAIDGKPVVAYDVKDARKIGDCRVDVGATDALSFEVSIGQSRSKVGSADPCDVAHTVAEMMVQTMKAGS